jgi:hypothetical protein
MKRVRFCVRMVCVCLVGVLVAGVSAGKAVCGAEKLKTENVILVTTDGLRWQEVFTGAEKELLNTEHGGVKNPKTTAKRYWRETPEERREVLMPFLWNVVAKEGQIYGNVNKRAPALITNDKRFSYPGYNEILTGFADPRIDSNKQVPNQNVTVLEWLHRKPQFEGRVAAFSSWNVVPFIINRDRCGFPVMGGWEPIPEKEPNEKQQLLNDLIAESNRVFAPELTDSIVFRATYEHLLRHKPRILFTSYLETDAWGHAGRYDLVLESAQHVDDYIRKLWETVQSIDQYRDKTTLIITTDHGRGSGLKDWRNHNARVEGAEYIWMAFLGPDTPPLGEREDTAPVTQSQIAATLAGFLGEDYHADEPRSGLPIADVLPKNP